MTVASLWKLLDEAGCSTLVGAQDILDPEHSKRASNPWNFNQQNQSTPSNRPTLAIDLSIWICEGLTSHAMSNNHANPALHLVYTRAIRLLILGIKLVVVVEGKRRVRSTEEADKFHRRRSGTAFWKACKACEQMFEHMGVPVVKAKAEGEALCALLSLRGIVDGVISNDGDCLLFGAKVVYTKFSIENLQNSNVKRYDAACLKGVVDSETGERRAFVQDNKIDLSRHDLVAFALLTGSDLAGNGFPKVGYKKAVRFIYKCKHDRPLSTATAAMDELQMWSKTAKVVANFEEEELCHEIEHDEGRCCSHCNHAGDKRSHLKNGCEQCGTEPGEPCFQLTASDRFRKSLREKALSLEPTFAPVMVIDAYLKPNDNQLPLRLEDSTSSTLQMRLPSLSGLVGSKFIIKGHSHAASRDFVTDSLARLMARRYLFEDDNFVAKNKSGRRGLSKEVPIPTHITRRLVKEKKSCYEISWKVQATVTDSDGNDIDGHEFLVVETQELVKKRYPELVEKFLVSEADRQKQGDAEQVKRKDFIENILQRHHRQEEEDEDAEKMERKRGGKRKRVYESFFEGLRGKGVTMNHCTVQVGETDEVKALMNRHVAKTKEGTIDDFDFSTIASGSLVFHVGEPTAKKRKKQYGKPKQRPVIEGAVPLGMTITVFKPTKQQGLEESTDEQTAVSTVIEEEEEEESLKPTPIKYDSRHVRKISLREPPQRPESLKLKDSDEHIRRMSQSMVPLQEEREDCVKTDRQERVEENSCQDALVPPFKAPVGSDRANHKRHRMSPLKAPECERVYGNKCHRHDVPTGSERDDQKENRVPDRDSDKEDRVPALKDVDMDIVATANDRCQQELVLPPFASRHERQIHDPDAWMVKIVEFGKCDDSAVGDNVNRRLQFENFPKTPAGKPIGKMPPLTPGIRRHLIVCDMGIPVEISPIKRRKRLWMLQTAFTSMH